jgi:hypothetical protein
MKTRKQSTSLYRRAYGLTLHELAAALECSVNRAMLLHYSGKLQSILDGTEPMPRSKRILLTEQKKLCKIEEKGVDRLEQAL